MKLSEETLVVGLLYLALAVCKLALVVLYIASEAFSVGER